MSVPSLTGLDKFHCMQAALELCPALGALEVEVTWLVVPRTHVIVVAERAAIISPVGTAASRVRWTVQGWAAELAIRVAQPPCRMETWCGVGFKSNESTVLLRVESCWFTCFTCCLIWVMCCRSLWFSCSVLVTCLLASQYVIVWFMLWSVLLSKEQLSHWSPTRQNIIRTSRGGTKALVSTA